MSETEAGPHLALLLDPTIPDTALQAALERDGITARAISSFTDAPAGTNGLLLGFGTFTEREILSGAARIAERAIILSQNRANVHFIFSAIVLTFSHHRSIRLFDSESA